MDSKNKAVEAVLIALSLGFFIGYHIWFFFMKTEWTKAKTNYYGINGKGKIARLIFTQIVSSNPKNAILGIQQARYTSSLPHHSCSLPNAQCKQLHCTPEHARHPTPP
jgi:L-cystine uptake protein TcyP (sodium:dicarboxylate symporter family)